MLDGFGSTIGRISKPDRIAARRVFLFAVCFLDAAAASRAGEKAASNCNAVAETGRFVQLSQMFRTAGSGVVFHFTD